MQPQKEKNNIVKLRAYAKVNLSLKVLGKRSDGYHDIDSIMQSVSLHDEIDIKPAKSGIKIKCSNAGIVNNTASKAAQLLFEEAKINSGIELNIHKDIPLMAGLGGGSADAAATLIGIDKIFKLNLHKHKLQELGAKIGSDVPFCITGGTCRVTGRGDNVARVNPQSGGAFILVMPELKVSTKAVYEEFDRVGKGDGGNDLEKAAVSIEPEIKKIKDSLIKSTGGDWRMSGSGPSLFLELMDLSEAEKYTDKIEGLKLKYHVVKRMDAGVEIIG